MKAWGFGDLSALRKLLSEAAAKGGLGDDGAGKRGDKGRIQWNRGAAPACGAALAAAAALHFHSTSDKKLLTGPQGPFPFSSLPFASISSATTSTASALDSPAEAEDTATESSTGLSFPKRINMKKPCCKGPDKFLDLSGLGIRLKNLFGLAKIKVYAFGVYVDPQEVKAQLGQKYLGQATDSLKKSVWLLEDLMSSDCPVVVRLVISYKSLKVGQMRKAFSESVGSSLETLSGKPEPEILKTFVSWFSDDINLQRGTVIDLKRGKGHLVTAEFDGKYAGSLKSALLGKALLSLYLGKQPFDSAAKTAVIESCATALAAAKA